MSLAANALHGVAPRTLALHVLGARFGRARALPASPDLAEFQQDAVLRLEAALARYRGAILADSVGLGKTRVGALVARRAKTRGARVLVVTPPVLCSQWRHALRDPQIRVLSMGALARASGAGTAPDLVVVDEAHAFRNPAARRYRALAALTRAARVLLITATPVNNSLRDLYWLLRLFAGDGAFADAGVPDLRACFEHAERSGGPGRIPAVLGRVMVRRTRSLLLEQYGAAGSEDGPDILDFGTVRLRFPRREPPTSVRYAPSAAWHRLLRSIEALELRTSVARHARSDVLLRMLLLRRAESSRAAGAASFRMVAAALAAMHDALARGLDGRPRAARDLRLAGEQLDLPALLLGPLPRDVDAGALARSIQRDRARLAEALDALHAGSDAKLDALRTLLESLRGRPVVVFTEFRDTAVYLHQALRGGHRVGLVHGTGARLGDAPAGRRTVIERFAPAANGVRAPPAREHVELLITTDVLAEGLDLHDAADVVSYDLPWNPVRLIQRVGRIDRLGSRHESVRSYHFMPDRQLERTLGVMRRLRRKLHAIDCSVGGEAGVLAARADLPRALRGDRDALRRIERDDALACDVEERLRTAYRRLTAPPETGLPLFEGPAVVPGASPALPGVLVARIRADLTLPGALTRRRGAVCCVFLERGGSPDGVIVRGNTVVEDDRLAGAALLAALGMPGIVALRTRDPAIALRAARLAARQVAGRSAAPPAGSVTWALRRRLLVLLERAPGGPSPAECTLVEGLLRSLQECPAGTERDLRRRLPVLRRLPLAQLCETLGELGGLRSAAPAVPASAEQAAGPARDIRPRPAGDTDDGFPARNQAAVRVLGVLLVELDPVDRTPAPTLALEARKR